MKIQIKWHNTLHFQKRKTFMPHFFINIIFRTQKIKKIAEKLTLNVFSRNATSTVWISIAINNTIECELNFQSMCIWCVFVSLKMYQMYDLLSYVEHSNRKKTVRAREKRMKSQKRPNSVTKVQERLCSQHIHTHSNEQ